MAYRYKQIKSLDEAYPNEKICAVYKKPEGNFTATVPDERLDTALRDEDYRVIVWRNDEDPNYYEGIDKDGRLRDMDASIHQLEYRRISLTENEVRTILAVFDELRKMPYDKLNTFLGSLTITEMNELNTKLTRWYKEEEDEGIYL